MKRTIAIIVTAVVLLALAAFPAYADRTPRFYLEGPESVKAGDRFTVDLKVEGDFEAHILSLRVGFDPTALRYVSSEDGEASFGIANSGLTVDGNEFTYGAMSIMDASSKEGVISKITFEVLSTASSSIKLKITVKEFEKLDLFSTNAVAIAHTEEDLTISVSGGSGTGPTPIPGPGSHTQQPGTTTDPRDPVQSNKPGNTDEAPEMTKTPSSTDGSTADPNSTPGADATPEVTGAPGETEPASTENGEDPGRSNAKPKWVPILIGAGGVVLAALIAVIVVIAVRSAKEKKNNG